MSDDDGLFEHSTEGVVKSGVGRLTPFDFGPARQIVPAALRPMA